MTEPEPEMKPEERAMRAMALLAEARELFYYCPQFDQHVKAAAWAIASWSKGLVHDYDRDKAA